MNENQGKPARFKGTVVSFLPRKGYGFIKGADSEHIFVHFSEIRGRGFRTLEVGEEVEYSRRVNEKGAQAVDVVRLNPPESNESEEEAPYTKRTW